MADWSEAFELEQRVREIIERQADAGWYFDLEGAKALVKEIEVQQHELYDYIRPYLVYNVNLPYKDRPLSKPFLANGQYSVNCNKWMGKDVELVGGPFTRVEFLEPNLDSDKQLKEQLFRLGWEPDKWNYEKEKNGKLKYDKNKKPIQTSPQLTESSYKSLKVGIGPELARYLILSHRKSQIEGLIKNVREDGTIPARANTIGTPTYRFRHQIVVNVPKASDDVLLGKEVRGLFIARPGRVLVGYDASGLEARMEAHYTFPFNEEYALALVHGDSKKGTDVHSLNAKKWEVDRDRAKNGKYCLGYGGYPPKLADTLGISLKKAKHIFDSFWSDDNPLYSLKRRLEWHNKKYGYIIGLDGRKIRVRKASDLINYLFQSSGAIVMKRSIIIMEDYRVKYGIDAIKVGDFHDESQNDVVPESGELFGKLGVLSIRKAGEFYKLNVPLDGEYKIGKDWSCTH